MLAPGLEGWAAASKVLAGDAPFEPRAVQRPNVTVLPPAERRRAAPSVAWSLAVAQEAVADCGIEAGSLAVVFVSSDGDGDIVHRLCTALTAPGAQVSPTDFHNSVHNAATGYWSIGARSTAPSTAMCAFDASFAAGLLEAATQIRAEGKPVLLVAVDLPYPQPLAPHRPVRHGLAAALVLSPDSEWEVAIAQGASTPLPLPEFAGNAAAACLPWLAALARPGAADIRLPYGESTLRLRKSR